MLLCNAMTKVVVFLYIGKGTVLWSAQRETAKGRQMVFHESYITVKGRVVQRTLSVPVAVLSDVREMIRQCGSARIRKRPRPCADDPRYANVYLEIVEFDLHRVWGEILDVIESADDQLELTPAKPQSITHQAA